ncbi:MAG: hypothetical protein LBJ08_07325 [Bifidobacteriaceae bacterium]|nr:hypothetical protein [Bifidobacteriaceae bacterium]
MVMLNLAWVWAGCTSAGVGEGALRFEEQPFIEARGWTINGPADRWIMPAADDGELAGLLAETAVWDHQGSEPGPQEVPPIPGGQTALLFWLFVGMCGWVSRFRCR